MRSHRHSAERRVRRESTTDGRREAELMLASVEDELERMDIRNRMSLCLRERVLKLKGTKQVEEFFETRNGRTQESAVLAKALKEGVGSGSREGESAQREWFTGLTFFFAQRL